MALKINNEQFHDKCFMFDSNKTYDIIKTINKEAIIPEDNMDKEFE